MNKFSYLIFDIFKNQKTICFLSEFNKVLKLSQEEIQKYQFVKLKKLLQYAEKNVTFYSKRFKECGFSAENFFRIEQLVDIPLLTRDDLQNNWNKIIANGLDPGKLFSGSSSGSSGKPISYRKDKNALSAGQAAHLIGWSFSGWKMNMKGLHIWGNPSTVNNEWKRVSSRLKAKVFRHHKYPAYKLTSGSKFYELFEIINKNKYDYLDGYTNAIFLFALFLKENGLSIKSKIKYVLTTAENLHDFQRKIIEEQIAPVFDTYGCSEINSIAYECSKCKSYHIIDPHVFVEFGESVDDNGPRELIITDLDNYAFPFIRYKNDDLGIPVIEKRINCDIKFTRLESISGRESDIIKFRDGGILSVPSFFGSMLLKKINGLKQYQIERVQEDFIRINLVKTSEFSDYDQKIIDSALKEYLNNRIRYEVRFLEKIEPSNTGKFKLVIDKINSK